MSIPIRSSTEITQIINRSQHALADIGLELVDEEKRGINSTNTDHRDRMYRLILLRSYLHNILDDDANIRAYYLASANEKKFNLILDGLVQLSQSFDGPGINIIGVRRNLLFFTGSGSSGGGGGSGGPATPGGVTFQNIAVDAPGEIVDQIDASDTDYAFYIIEIKGTNPGEGSRLDIIGFMWNGLATPTATEYRGADVGGSTAGVTITAALVAGQIQITANVPTDGWIIRGNRISFSNISFQNALAPMPIGGTVNQVIKKFSSTNYDYGWADINITDVVNLVSTLTQYLLLTGGNMSGAIAMTNNKITGLAAATSNGDALRYEQLVGMYALLTGATFSGVIAMGGNKITGLGAGTTNGDALRYEQLVGAYLLLSGGTMSGNIAMGGNSVTGLRAAIANGEAVRYEQLPTGYITGLNLTKLSIGAWNMSGTTTINVAHGLSDFTKFAFALIKIRNDANSKIYDLIRVPYSVNVPSTPSAVALESGRIKEVTSTNIVIESGFAFQDGNFVGTGFSRGTVYLFAEP